MRFLTLAALVAPLSAVPFAGGCVFLSAPEPLPTPTPVPTIAPTEVVFDPAQGQPRGTALNRPGDEVLPAAFRVAIVLSGDELILQSVSRTPAIGGGPDRIALGVPENNNPVRLAGIVAPKRGQPGFDNAVRTIQNWTAGQDLSVDIDPRFPFDLDNRRLVHVFFTGREGGEFAGQTLSLNRMMVRSGHAIVDLYSPTSFDQSEWLFDEAHARRQNAGLWPTNVFAALQQRPITAPRGTGARSSVDIVVPSDPRTSSTQGARPGMRGAGADASTPTGQQLR